MLKKYECVYEVINEKSNRTVFYMEHRKRQFNENDLLSDFQNWLRDNKMAYQYGNPSFTAIRTPSGKARSVMFIELETLSFDEDGNMLTKKIKDHLMEDSDDYMKKVVSGEDE